MKRMSVLAIVMALSGGGITVVNGEPVNLVCPMKKSDGQRTMIVEIALDEESSTVSAGTLKEIPAIFSSASVRWKFQGRGGQNFLNTLDRYTGEHTVSIINPSSGESLVIASGVCSIASEEKRKF